MIVARTIAESTKRPELKQLAADMIKGQQIEIDQMQGWLHAWYPG